MLHHILCPVDGSGPSGRAIDLAADLAERYGARLTLVHVTHMAGPLEGVEDFLAKEIVGTPETAAFASIGERILEDASEQARRARKILPDTVLDFGDPAERVLALAAQEGADCIVVGRRGRGRLATLLLGSVSSKLAQLAPCTTILVR